MPQTDCGSGMLPMLLCEASGLQILQLIVLTLIVAYGLFMLVVRRRKRLLAAEPMGAPSTLSGAPIAQPPNALPKKKDKKAKGEKTALATSGASAGGTAVRASSATHESGSHRDAFLASGSATGWTGDQNACHMLGYFRRRGARSTLTQGSARVLRSLPRGTPPPQGGPTRHAPAEQRPLLEGARCTAVPALSPAGYCTTVEARCC